MKLTPPDLVEFLCGGRQAELPGDCFQPVSRNVVPPQDRRTPDVDRNTLLRALGPQGQAAFEELLALGPVSDEQLLRILQDLSALLSFRFLANPEPTALRAALLMPGGLILKGPIKRSDRALVKIFEPGNAGVVSTIRDLVRASIAVDRPVELFGVAAALRRLQVDLSKVPKDRFAKPLPNGYRDLELHIRLPNGGIAEIQLHLKPILRVKHCGYGDGGEPEHAVYERIRAIDVRSTLANRERTEEEAQTVAALRERSTAWYQAAWAEADG